jgi:serine/threonine protein kinase
MRPCLSNGEVSAYLEGALRDGERQLLVEHLDQCEQCSELVAAVAEDLVETDPPLDELDRIKDPMLGRRIGNYVLQSSIGRGGMGVVYLGVNPSIGRKVAIKILQAADPANNPRDRFIAEARAATSIHHRNIVDVYDFGTLEDGRLYYIMEYLEGPTLKTILRERAPMSVAAAYPYVAQLCEGIEAAHERGIVHRDLKLDNIVVGATSPPRLKILDFGLVKLVGSESLDLDLTTTGTFMGTPLFVAPEQATGNKDAICSQTDIYSLGVIIYWMLYGRPPFWAEHVHVVLAMHIRDRPVPLSERLADIDPRISAIIDRCLEKDPSQRPRSALEVAAVFYRAQNQVSTTAQSEVGSPFPAPKRKNERQGVESDGSASFIDATLAQLPTKGLRKPLWLLVAIVIGVISVVVSSSLPGTEEPPIRLVSDVATDIGVDTAPTEAGRGIPPPQPIDGAVKDAATDRVKIVIASDDGELICQYREGKKPLTTSAVPCQISIKRGNKVYLRLVRHKYRPLVLRFVAAAGGQSRFRLDAKSRTIKFERGPPAIRSAVKRALSARPRHWKSGRKKDSGVGAGTKLPDAVPAKRDAGLGNGPM